MSIDNDTKATFLTWGALAVAGSMMAAGFTSASLGHAWGNAVGITGGVLAGATAVGVIAAVIFRVCCERHKKKSETAEANIKATSQPPVGKEKAEGAGRRRFNENESEGNRYIYDEQL